jgi:hypothetical protein
VNNIMPGPHRHGWAELLTLVDAIRAIGSILGGLLTLAGVFLVIRNEQSQRDREALDVAMINVLSTAKALRVWLVGPREPMIRRFNDEDPHIPFQDALLVARARSHRPEPRLSDLLGDVIDADDATASSESDPKVVTAAVVIAAFWIANPRPIRSGTFTFESAMNIASDHEQEVERELDKIRDGLAGELPTWLRWLVRSGNRQRRDGPVDDHPDVDDDA